MNYAETVKFIVAMIIMINPLGSLSIFLDLTDRYKTPKKREIAKKAFIAITVIMVASLWVGSQVLDLLGITIDSFRTAGGLILLLVGLSMLQSQESAVNHTPEDDAAAEERRGSIAIVPLALPIIIGPGAISTLVIASNDFPSMLHRLWLSFLCVLLAVGMYEMLHHCDLIEKVIGKSVMSVITRIMGMLIMAIAIGMIAKGLTGMIPALQAPPII